MTSGRRLDVLRAIVEDYVHTREPVGSRTLVERHALGVSPATIRNDMAVLEESGLIAQPHTSAGRIPTDLGYRVFVDRLSTVKPMSSPERRAIEEFLSEAVDLDDVIDRTVRLLAQLTGQVAVVQYPSLRRSALRHIELIADGRSRLIVIVITDTGRVEQRIVQADLVAAGLTDEDGAVGTRLAEFKDRLNAATVGVRLSALGQAMADLVDAVRAQAQSVTRLLGSVVEDTLAAESEERVVLAGTANLARSTVDFVQTISPVLDALEEHVVLLRLLTELAHDGELIVRIGRENEHVNLSETSVVTMGYGNGDDTLGRLGVLGPTRMDYPSTMAAVRAVARYVSAIVAE